jgi:hypothetical protein
MKSFLKIAAFALLLGFTTQACAGPLNFHPHFKPGIGGDVRVLYKGHYVWAPPMPAWPPHGWVLVPRHGGGYQWKRHWYRAWY